MVTQRYVTAAATGGGDGSSGSPWTIYEAFSTATSGDIVNVQDDSTYTLTASLSPTNSGSFDSPIRYRGYSSVIGDGGVPTINGGGSYNFQIGQGNHFFESIRFESTAAWPSRLFQIDSGGGRITWLKCQLVISGTAYAVYSPNVNLTHACINTLFQTSGDCVFTADTGASNMYLCTFYASGGGGGGEAAVSLARSETFVNNDIHTPGGGIALKITLADNLVAGNNFYGATSAIQLDGFYNIPIVANNVLWGDGGSGSGIVYSLSINDSEYPITYKNAIGNFGGEVGGVTDSPVIDTITLTATPFVSESDLSLNNTANGGAECRDVRDDPPIPDVF